MSTFGNNLIERLRTGLVDIQPENQLTDGVDCVRENLNSNPNSPTARTDEQIVVTCPVPLALD
jgi:hypothetical protein